MWFRLHFAQPPARDHQLYLGYGPVAMLDPQSALYWSASTSGDSAASNSSSHWSLNPPPGFRAWREWANLTYRAD